MLTFKRISNGMLVAAPRLWPFESPQHYIATEAQLAKIEARTWIVDLAYGLLVFVLLVIALVVGDQTGVGGTSWFLNLYSLAVIAVAAGSQIVTWLAVRQLLGALPHSNEHITFGERARMTAASAPWWRLMGADMLLAFLAVWLAPAGFNQLAYHFNDDTAAICAAWFWAIACAGAAGYHLYLTALKLK